MSLSAEVPFFDARRLGLPALSIMGLILAVVYGTWQIYGERTRIDSKIDTQFGSLREDLRGLNVNLEGLTEKLVARTAERWTRTDMATWCLKVRLMNKGFICPDPYDQAVVLPDVQPLPVKKRPAKPQP